MSKELPPGHPMSAHKDEVGQVMHRWKHHDPKPLHSGRGKGGKEGKVVKSQDQAIAIALSMAGKSKKGKGKTSDHAERLMSMGYSEEVSREVADMLDFSRCERPDGSHYGTSGNCRKGKQVSADEEAALGQLSQLLPKGEKILDSARQTRIATGSKEPKRKSEEDVVNKRGQMIGTSPRNMLIDNINGFKARLKDARSDEERKFLQEVIRKAEQQLQDEGG